MPKQSETFAFADEPPKEQPRKELASAQKLLDWVLRQRKQIITSKDLYQCAPRSIRFDRENAIETAEVLVRYGWLVPLPTRRRDARVWQVIRKGTIVHRTVAG
jgi:hypothetical protein